MRYALIIALLTVGVFTIIILSLPLYAFPGGNPVSSSPAQRVFKHVTPETKSVASLSLTIITILVALLALIGAREDIDQFFDTYPSPMRVDLASRIGRAVDTFFQVFAPRKCIVFILAVAIICPVVCFAGHLRPEPTATLVALHTIVEVAMIIATLLFVNILLRAFRFFLSRDKISRCCGT